MHRLLISIIMPILLFSSSAAGQGFEVLQVLIASEQVVLLNIDTGQEWVVEVGDEIEGWKITKIGQDYVTLAKKQEGQSLLLVKTIHVKGKRQIVEKVQKPQ